MKTIGDFIALLDTELGMRVTEADVRAGLDQVSDWDSVYMITLLALLERQTGSRISLPDALEASSLYDIYALAVAP